MTTTVRRPKTSTRSAPATHHCHKSPTGSHHWFIEPCRGDDYSPGVCGYCGETGMFPNYMPEDFVKWQEK